MILHFKKLQQQHLRVYNKTRVRHFPPGELIILGIPFILASRHQFSACCVKQKNINPVLVPFWTFLMKSWDKDLSYLNVHFSHIHNRSWLIWPTLLCYYHPLELLTRSIQSKTLWYFDLEEKWETVISLSNGASYPCN